LKNQYKNFATYLISQQAKDINELKNMNALQILTDPASKQSE
jgi:putative membrane protein